MNKCCATCQHYHPPWDYYYGTCEYPVPEYLSVGAAGGKFIGHPTVSGAECPLYKPHINEKEDSE